MPTWTTAGRGRLKDETGCTIWMHEAEVGFLQTRYLSPDELLNHLDVWFTRHGVSADDRPDIERGSMPMRFLVAMFEPDRTPSGGEMLTVGDYNFELIWTPGHSPGHICLYDQDRQLLISGDHILPSITPNVSLHPAARTRSQDFLTASRKWPAPGEAHAAGPRVGLRLPEGIEELRVHHHARLTTCSKRGHGRRRYRH
jgi:glyoxylase-like metal-dependent hydrolase (beta-lactamase superfamily II)